MTAEANAWPALCLQACAYLELKRHFGRKRTTYRKVLNILSFPCREGDLRVIRPLIYVREKHTRAFADSVRFESVRYFVLGIVCKLNSNLAKKLNKLSKCFKAN